MKNTGVEEMREGYLRKLNFFFFWMILREKFPNKTNRKFNHRRRKRKKKRKKVAIIWENSDNSVLVAVIVRKKLRKMAQTALVLKEHFGDGNKNIKRCLTKQK